MQIEITNDDRKPAMSAINGAPAPAPESGLHGIAERVAALGGQFEAGPCLSAGVGGFRLQTRLPVLHPEQQGASAAPVKTDATAGEEARP